VSALCDPKPAGRECPVAPQTIRSGGTCEHAGVRPPAGRKGSHLHVGDRLWSTEPKMRPMFTFITDTVEKKPRPHNATSRDLIYSRCHGLVNALCRHLS
jgi:hypothetical protein